MLWAGAASERWVASVLSRWTSLVVVRGTTAAVSPSMITWEVVVLADYGGGIACVDHPGVDLLPGDHERVTARHPPLHGDRTAGLRRQGSGPAGSRQAVAVSRRVWAGQGAQQLAVVADDSHLGAFHPQGDALASKVGAHAELRAGQTNPGRRR